MDNSNLGRRPHKKGELYLKTKRHLTISVFISVEKNLKDISEKQTHLESKVNGLANILATNNIDVPDYLSEKISNISRSCI